MFDMPLRSHGPAWPLNQNMCQTCTKNKHETTCNMTFDSDTCLTSRG